MSKHAQEYLDAFARGQDFVPPAKGVFADGRPDDEALAMLGKALEAGSPTVRENVVKLLVDMGRSTDPLTPEGADVLRHPRIIGLLAGKYLFRMKAPIILGACAGARTTTAALGAIEEEAKSKVPALGYTVTYAVGNTLLTVWGVAIVLLMS